MNLRADRSAPWLLRTTREHPPPGRNHVKSLERFGYKVPIEAINPTPASSCPQPA